MLEKIIETVLTGALVCGVTYGVAKGIYANTSLQIEKYLPLVEQNLALTEEEIKNGNFQKAGELVGENERLFWQLDRDGGMYHLLFPKGRKINSMFEDNAKLGKELQILKKYCITSSQNSIEE